MSMCFDVTTSFYGIDARVCVCVCGGKTEMSVEYFWMWISGETIESVRWMRSLNIIYRTIDVVWNMRQWGCINIIIIIIMILIMLW